MKKYLYILIIYSIIFVGCNEGLAPPELSEKTTVKGIVFYKDGEANWPPADSIKDLRVAAFKDYPPKDIINEILSGNAYFTAESLPINASSSTFSLDIYDAPTEINYVAVAQNYGGIMEWRALG
ncbi:MAG: hypothetical protein K8F24_12175, partial [Bacteroidales bacterium]|nr:hypothetical protein [Bacteroidales bacterium]